MKALIAAAMLASALIGPAQAQGMCADDDKAVEVVCRLNEVNAHLDLIFDRLAAQGLRISELQEKLDAIEEDNVARADRVETAYAKIIELIDGQDELNDMLVLIQRRMGPQ